MAFSLAKVSVPVSSSPGTKVYVEMPPEGYINGTEIGVNNTFTVDVCIENATDLVQWALNVQVDPNVLNISSIEDEAGTVLYDYADSQWMTTVWMVDEVNPAEGTIINATHAINQWPDLYPRYGGFNGNGKLCNLTFTVLDETAYSPIDLFGVLVMDGQNYTTGDVHAFPPDIVEDGHYNPPPPGGDAAVTNVVPSENQTYQPWTINVTVTVLNNGTEPISFNVTAYYENVTAAYEIGTQTVPDLAGGAEMNVTFSWPLSGVALGLYDVKANATLAGDINPGNNEFVVYNATKVKYIGDVDGSAKVDYKDLWALGSAYGSVPGHPRWNKQCDFDETDKVDYKDLWALGARYGDTTDAYLPDP